MEIIKRIAKLIDVKSLVTFTVIGCLSYMFCISKVEPETYCAFAGTIIAYYFTKKDNNTPAV